MMTEEMRDGEGEAQRGGSLRADAQRNRERIVRAAWRLLVTHSPEELSMEEVANEAGLGKGTLYRHFPTKDSLFEALLDHGGLRITACMRERIPPEADAATKLRAFVALIYDVYEEYQINIELALGLIHRYKYQSGHPHAVILQRVRAILEQGMREGSFRPLDLDFTTSAVVSLISPFTFARQRQSLGYSRAEIEERVVDLLQHALQA